MLANIQWNSINSGTGGRWSLISSSMSPDSACNRHWELLWSKLTLLLQMSWIYSLHASRLTMLALACWLEPALLKMSAQLSQNTGFGRRWSVWISENQPIQTGISGFVLRSCTYQLTGLFASIFNESQISLWTTTGPLRWSQQALKKWHSCLNDYSPEALTLIVMKVFERFL